MQSVEMIPFGLLAGFVDDKEVRITEISTESFCFRVREQDGRESLSFEKDVYYRSHDLYDFSCLHMDSLLLSYLFSIFLPLFVFVFLCFRTCDNLGDLLGDRCLSCPVILNR